MSHPPPAKRPSRALHRVISGACGEATATVDRESRGVTWEGGGLAKLLGYPPGELRMDLEDIPHLIHKPDEDLFAEAWQRMLNGNPVEMESRFMDALGQPRWVRLTAAPAKNGRNLLLAFEDVHLRRGEIDAQVEQRRTQGLESMAAGLAHEFNNLLTPVRGFLEIAINRLGRDNPVSAGLQTALGQVDRCSELVDMIQYSGRKAVLHRRRSDLASVLHATLRLARALSPEARPVMIANRISRDLPEVHIDQTSVRVAMVHLLRNAVAAMPNGGEVTVSAEVLKPGDEADTQPEFVWVSVRDRGTGIRPEDLAFIFDPFFTTRGRSGAKGLGLSMVQGIVEQHGGWVQVRTEPGLGTDVRMYFPIWRAGAEEAITLPPMVMGGRAVVCEPSKGMRLLAARVFEALGWRVVECDSFAEALEILDTPGARFDLVCSDAAQFPSPVAAGLDALRKWLPTPRIVVLNADGREADWQPVAPRPGLKFAGQPFSPRLLRAAVESLWPGSAIH